MGYADLQRASLVRFLVLQLSNSFAGVAMHLPLAARACTLVSDSQIILSLGCSIKRGSRMVTVWGLNLNPFTISQSSTFFSIVTGKIPVLIILRRASDDQRHIQKMCDREAHKR